jgi:transketolase
MNRLPGLDMSTGSLGLGVSAAVGIALGAKLDRRAFHVYTMLGDGECQEGIVWEAADIAARYRLDNLTAIIDVNGLQQYGWPGVEDGERQAPFSLDALEARWRAFGWKVAIADGHDFASIFKAFDALHAADGVPGVILAKTVKGKGVPFMEGKFAWHAKVPSDSELKAALEALEAGLPQ